MNPKLKGLRLFGRWADAPIQGTSRTYRVYASHPLDRLLSVALVLIFWVAMFLYIFCRAPEPGSFGILLRGIGVIYLPGDMGPLIRFFLVWMAIPAVGYVGPHILEHGRQRRILRGELVARQGVLRKIGYTQDLKYRTVAGSRFLLEVSGKHGKMIHEVYKMPEWLFKEFKKERRQRACRVELALLPPKHLRERKHSTDFPGAYTDRLHMRVEHIFYLEMLSARCKPLKDFLFVQERNTGGRKREKKEKRRN
jgi:hypothetical protein